MKNQGKIHTSRRDLLKASLGLAAATWPALEALAAEPAGKKPLQADLCIYGATPAGIAAAVQMHRLGKTAILVEPGKHVGGLTAGGLGATDIGNPEAIGGISREFYSRVREHYTKTYGPTSPQEKECGGGFYFEPHVAERVFRSMLAEAGVPLLTGRLASVQRDGTRLTGLVTASGQTVHARMFLDATYEGDLMAAASVGYVVGRESNAKYSETLNGVQFGHPYHNFRVPIDPYVKPGDPNSGLLPGISSEHPGKNGEGDHRIQAYNFRMCLTDVPENRLPFPKPDGYDPERYTLLARYITAGVWDALTLTKRMPNGKTDTNNFGAFSTDNIGMNYEYPDGDPETRDRIFRDHVVYQQGMMWFLCNDDRVPRVVRDEVSRWGLPKDEFTDTGGWPFQLYVREARRMVSEHVMTEHNCRGKVKAEDSIGLAAYTMDSHHVRRVVVDGHPLNEGDVQVGGFPPYPIAYRSMVPWEKECPNLLVPVCLSASHIAYGSIRMEPVFMILGQSAATAAALALDARTTIQGLDMKKLQKRLHDQGQILEWTGSANATRVALISPKSFPGIVLDDEDGVKVGEWVPSSRAAERKVGVGYLHDGNANKGKVWISYTPELPVDGIYEIFLISVPNPNRATNVPVSVEIEGVEPTVLTVNQQLPGRNGFLSIGRFRLPAGKRTTVTVSNRDTNGYVVSDGIQFLVSS